MRWIFPLLLLLIPSLSHALDWQTSFLNALGNGGVLVTDETGKVLLEHRADEHFIPASTIKVATTACALNTLGGDYRFVTQFYYSPNGDLSVKGYGDPLLLSQELAQIAENLKQKGIAQVTDIILDNSYFDMNLAIDGVSRSSNPYDALNGALLANFNTINIRKLKNGTIISAETQTPLTPIAKEMGRKLPAGTHRINLGASPDRARRYVGELLAAFLTKEGVSVTGLIRIGSLPVGANPIYRYESSHSLEEILRGMLDFSTNFTANQIFLTMGAHVYGSPATVQKGIDVLDNFLKTKIGWKNFQIAEGSGLSRLTQVTPRQMIMLLDYFAPDQNLLPLEADLFLAKTGTLNGANTLIGYFPLPGGHEARFAFMINRQVPFGYKFKLGKMLYNGLHGIEASNAKKIAR